MNRVLDVPPGNVLITQDESSSGFYVLLSGKLEVFKDGVLICAYDQRGTIFGELSGILNEPRSSTVIARSQVKAIHVSSPDLIKFIQKTPDIGAKIIKTLAARLVMTSRNYASISKSPFPQNVEMVGNRIKEAFLDNVKGLGPARRRSLDLEFETIENLKTASLESIRKVDGIGDKMAEQLYSLLHE